MLKNLLVTGLLCASLGLAQGGKGGGKSGGGGDMGAETPMAASATKFDDIANTLNLNKEQKKAVKTILDEGAKEAAPLRDQVSKSRVAVGKPSTPRRARRNSSRSPRPAAIWRFNCRNWS